MPVAIFSFGVAGVIQLGRQILLFGNDFGVGLVLEGLRGGFKLGRFSGEYEFAFMVNSMSRFLAVFFIDDEGSMDFALDKKDVHLPAAVSSPRCHFSMSPPIFIIDGKLKLAVRMPVFFHSLLNAFSVGGGKKSLPVIMIDGDDAMRFSIYDVSIIPWLAVGEFGQSSPGEGLAFSVEVVRLVPLYQHFTIDSSFLFWGDRVGNDPTAPKRCS